MNRILILLSAAFFLTMCTNSKGKLELKLVKGESYNYNIASEASVLQTINDQQMKIEMKINGKMVYKVKNIIDSIYEMEVSYKALSMSMGMPGREVVMDSEKNDNLFSTIMSGLINKTFIVKMSKTGRVKEVKNIDTLFQGIFDKIPEITEEQKDQIRAQLQKSYGEETFRSNIEMASAIFSQAPVGKGDKWKIKTDINSTFSAEMESVYQLTDIKNDYLMISGESTIRGDKLSPVIQSGGMPMKLDMSGKMKSDIKIDRKTGWVIDAKISQNISGFVEIKDNSMMPGGMKYPMSMNNEMTITD